MLAWSQEKKKTTTDGYIWWALVVFLPSPLCLHSILQTKALLTKTVACLVFCIPKRLGLEIQLSLPDRIQRIGSALLSEVFIFSTVSLTKNVIRTGWNKGNASYGVTKEMHGVPMTASYGVPMTASYGVPMTASYGVPMTASYGVPMTASYGVPMAASYGVPMAASYGVPMAASYGVPMLEHTIQKNAITALKEMNAIQKAHCGSIG